MKRIGTLTNLVSATLVTGDASQIRALAANPDVVAIYRVQRKTIENANSDAFTKALATWKETGNTGYGVRIGIVDTGVDYTHADFGGPGTKAAYDEAVAATTILPGLFDHTKFIGGYDFAGHFYDADPDSTTPGHTSVAVPDANPIDSLATSGTSGHGTHVSGSAAGYGVDADGKTFSGDYSTLDSLAGWEIGPGTAPEAQIFGLKVFGDIGGSTDLTSLALDRAADPNNDGDFSDRLDVVNLSLGSDGTVVDDPENLVIDKLSALGTVVAVASGNAGDVTDIGGGPGNAASALTVANSVASPVVDALKVVTAPDADLNGKKLAAQNSVLYSKTDDATGEIAKVVDAGGTFFDGCTAFTTAEAGQVAGKLAYLAWDDAAVACGSKARFNNAQAAGAIGVVLPSQNDIFTGGINGNENIPGVQMTKSTTATIDAQLAVGTVVATVGPSLARQSSVTGYGDTLNSSSSRGVHGSLGVIKPDVAAPGSGINSAASGEGDGSHVLSGTSMATPHVAGIAALVVRAHPAWNSAQVKAAVMNTATHDVTTEPNGGGDVFGPQRVGSGRVDALDAVQSKVIAYNKAKPALTSVTFGVVPVGATTVVQKQVVTVKNFDNANAKTFATSVTTATTAGGATIKATPATITVPKGGSVDVTLTLTADPKTLKKQIDPTSATKVSTYGREFVTEVAGRLVLKPATGPELRLPVQAAPKLVSALKAASPTFTSSGAGASTIPVTGRGITTGGFDSISAPLILAATSPKLPAAATLETSKSAVASGDIRYVGWSSTVPYVAAINDPTNIPAARFNQLQVGIAFDGNWASLGRVVTPVIDIDLNKDNKPDLQTIVSKWDADSDLTTVETYDLRIANPANQLVGLEFVNNEDGSVDTGVYDNSVLVAPINLADVGIKSGDKPAISVWTYSGYAANDDGVVDEVAPFTVDPFAPPFWFATDDFTSTWTDGTAATSIPVVKAAGVTSGKLLVLTPQNSDPTTRAQVVDVKTSSSTKLAISPTSVKFGTAAKATATVTGAAAAPTGKVEFREGAKVLASANLAVSGKVGKATVTLPKSLSVGKHTLTAVYLGNAGVATSKGTATLTVAKAKPSVALSTSSWTVKKNSTPKLTVSVKGSSGAPAPTGKVVVKVGSKSVTATLSSGKVTVRLPKVTKATTVSVTYKGSASYSSATADHKIKLK
ncbi:S8 family serine peptidase [Cellulomonas rhizosphaerae]|uniref:S8 family serine peptidase n=1 Tax=Cellulomonas rhizosphaerae TaxID=2293719 RepID=UPI00131484C4|nr:S8 family serine peptidase [Cellulomonas rhizosphaerae]